MQSASAFAPGKVILLGEHSVVFGEPALAAALDRGLTVTVRRGATGAVRSADERTRAALDRAAGLFDVEPGVLTLEVDSQLPVACGLGSSAALSLGLIRAISRLTERPLGNGDELRMAAEVENVFHGTASGVDVATSAAGRVVFFQRGTPPRVETVRAGRPFAVVVGVSGELRSTAGPVGRLRERQAERPTLYGKLFALAGDVTRAGRDALEGGDFATLGALMDVAQGLLNACGVSTPTLERMVSVARSAGALGAKLTGAGGGGAIVALTPDRPEAVHEALGRAGFDSFITTLGKSGAREEEDAVDRRHRA